MHADVVEVKAPHVAIIDDEPATIRLIQLAFLKRKIPISFTARNGFEGACLFETAEPRPDVIIMDHRMPVANGIEATMMILSMAPKTKIIFLSADEKIEEDARKAGAIGFLTKPVNIKTIIDSVYAAV